MSASRRVKCLVAQAWCLKEQRKRVREERKARQKERRGKREGSGTLKANHKIQPDKC